MMMIRSVRIFYCELRCEFEVVLVLDNRCRFVGVGFWRFSDLSPVDVFFLYLCIK